MMRAVLLLATALSATATHDEIKLLASLAVPGNAYDLAKEGDYTYLLKDKDMVHIHNVRDKTDPKEVRTMDQLEGKSLLTDGKGMLYIALPTMIRSYDISRDPKAPVLRSTYRYPTGCTKTRGGRFLEQSPDHIYLTCHEKDRHPEAVTWFIVLRKNGLSEAGHLKIPGMDTHTSSVWFNGKVYATMSSNSIIVIDVSDPEHPTEKRSFPHFDIGSFTVFQGIYWKGHIYGVTDSHRGALVKFDAATGLRQTLDLPSPLGQSRCTSIQLYNSKLYLACKDQGLIVVDEPLPDTIVLLGQDNSGFLLSLVAEGGYIFASGDTSNGLNIYGVPEEIPEIKLLASLAVPGNAYDLAKEGDYTYLLKDKDMVHIHNVRDKTDPKEVGTMDQLEGKSLLTDGKGMLYIALPTMIKSYDISRDPKAPVLRSTYRYPTGCTKTRGGRFLEQSPDHIYLTCHEKDRHPEAVTWFIVLRKNGLSEAGHLKIPGMDTHTSSVWFNGKVYATMSSNSIIVIDVSDPEHPEVERSFPHFDIGSFTVFQGIYWKGHIYGVTDSHKGTLVKFDAATGMQVTVELPYPLREGDGSRCTSIQLYNSKLYLACKDQGLVAVEEPAANTFVLLGQDNSGFLLSLVAEGGYIFASGDTSNGLNIYGVPEETDPQQGENKGTVELVGGAHPVVVKEVGKEGGGESPLGVWVGDDVSGQQWVRIPEWLEGSTAHMGAFGKEGMYVKLVCPHGEDSAHHTDPCTFYVTVHNCLPCSSGMNGGLPKGLLDAGFEAAGCGPRYLPTFAGAPTDVPHHPTVTFRLQVEAGSAPIVIPVTRKLLHFVVFIHSAGQQCSLKDRESCAMAEHHCDYYDSKCVDKPMCPTRTGPVQPFPHGRRCTCFPVPRF